MLMKPRHLFVYTEEVYIHVQLALFNYDAFRNIVNTQETRQDRKAWMYLQSFLSHFGMVSKLLYAPSARNAVSKQRAVELQQHLVTDTASALNDRGARDAIEHLDERLDNWLASPDKGVLESVFESKADFEFIDQSGWIIRRVFLIAEEIFITQEADGPKEMELAPIVLELQRLGTLCAEKLI